MFSLKINLTNLCENTFGVLSVMVVVRKIVGNSLSIFHNSGDVRLQMEEQAEKVDHNAALLLTAREQRAQI